MAHDFARLALGTTAALLASGLLLSATTAQAAPLNVTTEGVRSDRGMLRVGVYSASDRQVATLAVPAVVGRLTVGLDVPPGAYAVRIHHDEDGDGRLATGPFGMPREGYGFSNRAKTRFGVPSFQKMRVRIGASPAAAVATLRY